MVNDRLKIKGSGMDCRNAGHGWDDAGAHAEFKDRSFKEQK